MEINLKRMARGQPTKGLTCPAKDYIWGWKDKSDQEDKKFGAAAAMGMLSLRRGLPPVSSAVA